MKLLWLGPYLPAPGGSGADLRSYYLIRELKRRGATLHGCFLDTHAERTRRFFETVDLYPVSSTAGGVRSVLGGVLGVPFSYGRYYHPELGQSVPSGAVVYVDHLHMTVNNPAHADRPTWLDEHNLEYVLWEEYARQRGGIVGPLMGWEARRVFQYEMDQIDASSGVSIPSELQKQALPEKLRRKVQIVPNGVPEDWLRQGEKRLGSPPNRIRDLGFIGGYDWAPNRRGVEVFLDRVWEDLIREGFDGTFHLAGRDPDPAWDRRYDGVVLEGYVESSREFFDRIDALVVPLEIGSGTRLKILEAIARGVPVFTTGKGAEGLEVPSLPEAADVEALGDQLREGLEAPRNLDRRREACFREVADRYRWSDIGEGLHRRLRQLT